MSFGTELQSRSAHEALLAAQDAEIYTLETIKKSITQRIKCDRDYAVALSAIVNGAQKQDTVQSGFQTQTAWVSILSETESLIQMVRDNADKMFQSTLDTILNVISEKKALRKTYADERARLDSDLQKFQNTVNNIQTEYKRKLEKLQQSKLKYEEQCKKGKQPQKIGELQSRYVKSVGRVHNIHNDYIVALSEANLYQQHYASVLLPALLEFQQRSQEALVQQCKEALLEYSSLTNCSTDEFQRKHENIRVAVENISPTTEYNAFVLNHRADPVLITPLTFESHILDNFSETLQPEKIRIDDLTVDFIKQRHKQYSDDLSRSQQQVATKKAEIENVQSELDNSSSTSLPTSLVMLTRKRTLEQLKRELLEVQCVEEKLSSLVQLLDEPLKLLGSDQPPSAIPDISDMTPTCDLDGSSSTSRLAAALSNVQLGVTQFKTIARRLGRHHQPTMSSIRHTSISSSDEPNVSFKNGTVGATSNGPKVSSTTSSVPVEGYQQFDFMAEQSHQPSFNPGRPLDDEDWYHGVLPREEVQRLLVEDGDYLVRASKNRTTKETQYVLSVMWQTHKHFIVQESEGRFRFEGESFPTVQELIIYQHKSMQPVTRRSEAMLKKPILRADWELRNDDIELHQKIGSGQFGEVFRGTYKITNEEVAVKTCRETLHDDVKRKFLQEGRILKQYDHPNIVRFIGIAAQRPPVMIVMEYVSGGALLNFLRKQGPRQSHKTLINMCKDAASGMAYLEEKNCLHRDLAARNCLVDSDNTVKISDFGMSREEQEYVVSGGLKQIPIKWTAPEALNYGTYTSACDVWSYGVLMWEVFSFGAVPYPGLTNAQARDKVDDGYRMPPPDNTPDQIYQLMMHCWEQEAKKRPHFAEIETQLELIISSIV